MPPSMVILFCQFLQRGPCWTLYVRNYNLIYLITVCPAGEVDAILSGNRRTIKKPCTIETLGAVAHAKLKN
jgi:hypothetical protein